MMKKCPKCESHSVVKYSSLQYCTCAECGHMFDWTIEEDQKPLVSNNRDKRRE